MVSQVQESQVLKMASQVQDLQQNISVHKNYFKKIPLTTDTPPLIYNAVFKNRTSNNSLNSTFINTQKHLNRTTNLKQQDSKKQSHFLKEKSFETNSTTTQQSITTPANNYNTTKQEQNSVSINNHTVNS